MFLFEYIIKLLMGNSDALFMGLLVVVFGYYGWLLWNISNQLKSFLNSWDKYLDKSAETRSKIFDMDSKISKMEGSMSRVDDLKGDIKNYKKEILEEIEEESDEVKEIVKILLGHYRKVIKNKKGDGDYYETGEGEKKDR